ncbi:MAG: aldolase/citrate lyase family protein [Polaromonas sp.]|nr:aldolase/citrate lyase family protein [Polaromonas sp.]
MKQRGNIRERQLTLGTFVKTDSPQITEILGTTDLDFVVVDAEHAPFDRLVLDRHMMAGRAGGIPVLVRVPDTGPATIQSALDLGAAGILVPRVDTAQQAAEIVSRAKFRKGGTRGFSISPRFAGYGTVKMSQAIDAADQTLVICQIESAQGVAQARQIAMTTGVDGLFIGRADLSLSLGIEDIRSAVVSQACEHIIEAATAAGITAAMFVPNADEAAAFMKLGVNCFVVSSDQSLMRSGAQQFSDRMHSPLRQTAPS